MALSESGLEGQGITPGPTIYGPKGHRVTVRPKSGPIAARKGGKQSFYVRPSRSRGRGRRK